MSKRPERTPETDAIELLMRQHDEIRRLFREVEEKSGEQRVEPFERLCRYLAVHETAEEEIVHPIARRSIDDGDAVVNARLAEENESKKMLQALERLGPSAQGFDALFRELRDAVQAHADHEERDEFPALKTRSGAELRVMATAIKAAEATAPTHPHPGIETATENLVAGPFAAVADRTRDLVRQMMRRSGT